MNKYESVIIIKDNISEEERKKIIEKVKEYIEENGKIDKIEKLRIYEIKKYQNAYYYVLKFYSNEETIIKLDRLYRITEEIIKFIIVKSEED